MKEKKLRILIDETQNPPGMQVSTKFFSFSELRNGILTPLQRIRDSYENVTIYYKNTNPLASKAFIARNSDCKEYNDEPIDKQIHSPNNPWETLSDIFKTVEDDLSIWKEMDKWKSKQKPKNNGVYVQGKKKYLHIHPSATIAPGVVINVDTGPVVIDKDAKISPFSYLEGPLYIGKKAHIDNARITGGCILGDYCRIGGEVENSLFGNFSNKHHEGFVGHSFVGSWVNFGALATTSDLKNNYGYIKLNIGETQVNTETIKFGSIIGDFVKISIGCMLNTGTVIDIASNIVNSSTTGYTPPFTWITTDTKYRLDHFIDTTKKIMARREQKLLAQEEKLLSQIYEY